MHDVIVLGVGTFGAAACEALARGGAKVLGLEQFSVAHNRGSHHGKSRMFRMAYYEHPDYVPLLQRAYEGWKALEARSGVRLFHEVGAPYLGRPQSELMAGSLEAARRHGLAHRVLSRADLAREFPPFHVPDDHAGFLERRAGFVLPELAIETMVDLARRSGATVLEGARVKGWTADGGSVTVHTESAAYSARALIITAGAWSGRLIADLGVPLVVTRQVLGWVQPASGEPFRNDGQGNGCPCWALGYADGSLHYGFPIMPGESALKIALHARGAETDPDRLDKTITPDDEATFRSVMGVLPGARGPTVRTCVCMYTNSPDGHFIIDRHPRHANVWLACGFSGHGFKFAPAIGGTMADLAMRGRTDLPIEFLSLKRFRS
jgi:sarcosine oxidase